MSKATKSKLRTEISNVTQNYKKHLHCPKPLLKLMAEENDTSDEHSASISLADDQDVTNKEPSIEETESQDLGHDEVAEADDGVHAQSRAVLVNYMGQESGTLNEDGEKWNDEVVDSVVHHARPFLHYAIAQAQDLKHSVVQSTDVAVKAACQQLEELHMASSNHLDNAKGIVQQSKMQYRVYEDLFFGKLKEGVKLAVDNPGSSIAVGGGLALMLMRGPRKFLLRHTIWRFRSEEAMLASAEKRVQEMRQSVDIQKNECKKLEERVKLAEEELLRGQTKLKHAGLQLRSLIRGHNKGEGKAKSLIENLRDLSGRQPLKLRAEVASMAAEMKKQRNALEKHINRIANYNIPI